MWQTAQPLAVSVSERRILEEVIASRSTPKEIRKRGRIVLMAGEGVANYRIGQEVGLSRPQVLVWRRRFQEEGILGLWDAPGTLPAEPIDDAVEQAIVNDCLYQSRLTVSMEMLWDPSLHWNVRNLARRHGVSPATVQRIWKKHGIRMERHRQLDQGVDISQLKISPGPFFGVTMYAIAGLFYETWGPALMFCARPQRFSELTLADLDLGARRALVQGLSRRLRDLEP